MLLVAMRHENQICVDLLFRVCFVPSCGDHRGQQGVVDQIVPVVEERRRKEVNMRNQHRKKLWFCCGAARVLRA